MEYLFIIVTNAVIAISLKIAIIKVFPQPIAITHLKMHHDLKINYSKHLAILLTKATIIILNFNKADLQSGFKIDSIVIEKAFKPIVVIKIIAFGYYHSIREVAKDYHYSLKQNTTKEFIISLMNLIKLPKEIPIIAIPYYIMNWVTDEFAVLFIVVDDFIIAVRAMLLIKGDWVLALFVL